LNGASAEEWNPTPARRPSEAAPHKIKRQVSNNRAVRDRDAEFDLLGHSLAVAGDPIARASSRDVRELIGVLLPI
jgi:hypothetical protein